MSILLDTHVWLWSLLEPERLAARAVVNTSEAELHLSPVSVWEAMFLIEKGRVTVDDDAQSWLRAALESSPVVESPLTFEVASAS